MSGSWLLINTTAVRTEDVRRIEKDVVAGFGIFYNVTMADGKVLRVAIGKPGADWCCLQWKQARSAAVAAEQTLVAASYIEEKTRSRHDESPEPDDEEEDI